MTTADTIVGERIHQILWRERITQAQLGKVLNLAPNNVSMKLRGQRTWMLDELLATARFLGVSITELLPDETYEPAPAGRGRGRQALAVAGEYAIGDSNSEPADYSSLSPGRGAQRPAAGGVVLPMPTPRPAVADVPGGASATVLPFRQSA